MKKSVRLIRQEILDEVTREAKAASRQRKNHNFHQCDESLCHRLLNAMEPDSYITPHCHLDPEKDEMILVLRGRLGVVFFDDEGTVMQTELLSPAGDVLGVNIPHGEFHTFVSLESGTVFFESKAGPYRPLTAEERAPWAPGEGSDEAAAYLAEIRKIW
ncbi:MAG: WbuC family cupin fold metalloprotein [Geobacteraceae bacterium]